ncbi:hypothetical protein [Clostridium sp. D33t1_170424_F3]|uniref:hypothetical protein n=1 Tax=Clostridium sp. D33t1_170424_F3 TaxID=2787099 RepID=UPI0018ABD7B3|nr:hypothetical protein [Clostridium sp. D33t1_170424_F3]
MLDIIERFNEQERENEKQREVIDMKIAARLAQIERLKKRRERLFGVDWVKGIVEPLAAVLAARAGLSWEIYGPFGLRSATSIYLREDMSRSITEQTTRSIHLVPMHNENGGYIIHYETGETDDSYQKGSLGERNGMNRKTAPLPDTIEEIEKLLVTATH